VSTALCQLRYTPAKWLLPSLLELHCVWNPTLHGVGWRCMVHLTGATCCANQSSAPGWCTAVVPLLLLLCCLEVWVLAGVSPATFLVHLAMLHLQRAADSSAEGGTFGSLLY
jgi:hypothetical protein